MNEVVLIELFTKPLGMHAHDGIGAWVVGWIASEDFDSDCGLFDLVMVSLKALFDTKPEKLSGSSGRGEDRRGQYPLKLSLNFRWFGCHGSLYDNHRPLLGCE